MLNSLPVTVRGLVPNNFSISIVVFHVHVAYVEQRPIVTAYMGFQKASEMLIQQFKEGGSSARVQQPQVTDTSLLVSSGDEFNKVIENMSPSQWVRLGNILDGSNQTDARSPSPAPAVSSNDFDKTIDDLSLSQWARLEEFLDRPIQSDARSPSPAPTHPRPAVSCFPSHQASTSTTLTDKELLMAYDEWEDLQLKEAKRAQQQALMAAYAMQVLSRPHSADAEMQYYSYP
jgi:hypothetical protein